MVILFLCNKVNIIENGIRSIPKYLIVLYTMLNLLVVAFVVKFLTRQPLFKNIYIYVYIYIYISIRI